MATIAQPAPIGRLNDERFFMTAAILMALVLVSGFTLQFAMGRSSFASPLPVHLHALAFFGWTALYLTQNAMIASGTVAVHRKLGWLAVVLVPLMVLLGTYLTVHMVQQGRVPFFFQPGYFLIMNPVTVLTFAGLVTAAILMRRRTAWHRRLMFCGMAMLLGPGFGRLLPGPLLMPWVGWTIFAVLMLFPLAGVVADLRRSGKVHPAWWCGIATMLIAQISISLISNSAAGTAIYRAVTADTPGAAMAPLDYPPPPPGV